MNHLWLDPKQSQFLEAIADESRLRILASLNHNGRQTIYGIGKWTGLDRKVVQKHLPPLKDASLVNESEEQRIIRHALTGEDIIASRSLYGLNHALPCMKSVCELLEEIEATKA
jgi:DNA-binding transcriptional ArsR family regulator